jgi:FKBP-type peptidyl-prolyl cis-trans isomerase 2
MIDLGNPKHKAQQGGHCDESDTGSPTLDIGTVAPGHIVEVAFVLRDEDGTLVDTDQDHFTFTVGSGQVLPQIEQGLLGLRTGETKTVRLKATEAFGKRDASNVVDFDRQEFPPDVKEGDHYEAEQVDGARLVLRVVDVGADYVSVDLNHPLAGQSIALDFVVKSVQPDSERQTGTAANIDKGHSTREHAALLPVESLLRGRTER